MIRKPSTLLPCLTFTISAFILYFPAMMIPFMEITLYGVHRKTTVWGGVVSLANEGSWFIAIIVLLASIVIPFFKILALLILTASVSKNWLLGKRMHIYRFVEVIGRWSMLDIFLLAILVSMIKLHGWASVSADTGAIAFTGVVIFTMLATSFLNPELLKEEGNSHA